MKAPNLFSMCALTSESNSAVIWLLAMFLTPCGALHLVLEREGTVYYNRKRNAPLSLVGYTCNFSIPYSLTTRNAKLDDFVFKYGRKGSVHPDSRRYPFAYDSRLGPSFEEKYPEGWIDVVNYDDPVAVAALAVTPFTIADDDNDQPTIDYSCGSLKYTNCASIAHQVSESVSEPSVFYLCNIVN